MALKVFQFLFAILILDNHVKKWDKNNEYRGKWNSRDSRSSNARKIKIRVCIYVTKSPKSPEADVVKCWVLPCKNYVPPPHPPSTDSLIYSLKCVHCSKTNRMQEGREQTRQAWPLNNRGDERKSRAQNRHKSSDLTRWSPNPLGESSRGPRVLFGTRLIWFISVRAGGVSHNGLSGGRPAQQLWQSMRAAKLELSTQRKWHANPSETSSEQLHANPRQFHRINVRITLTLVVRFKAPRTAAETLRL